MLNNQGQILKTVEPIEPGRLQVKLLETVLLDYYMRQLLLRMGHKMENNLVKQ
jgi:hypothetical protein